MTAELCPTCGIWWRGVEHSCRLPISSTTTDLNPTWGAISKDEIQRLRAIEEAARAVCADAEARIYLGEVSVPAAEILTLRAALGAER